MRRLMIWLPVVLFAGCTVALDPGDAIVTCTTDGDCPSGLVCAESIGRCLRFDGDTEPPGIVEGSLTITPLVSASGTVEITFTVTEELTRAPDVALAWTGSQPPYEQLASLGTPFEPEQRTFTLNYAANAMTDPESSASVRITLRDVAGNQIDFEIPRAVVFDFQDPTIGDAQISYVPDPGNPLSEVSAARVGTTAIFRFFSSEAIAGDPIVQANCGAQNGSFSRAIGEASTTFFTYEFVLDSGFPTAGELCPLEVTLTDLAGNTSTTQPMLSIELDVSPPVGSVAVQNAELKHLRVPWGADRTLGLPRQFLVPSDYQETDLLPIDEPALDCDVAAARCIPASSIEEAGEQLFEVRFFGAGVGGALLGRMQRRDSWWPITLLSASDSPELWISVIDNAGNESERVRIDAVEWIATMGFKEPGSVFSNPHRFEEHALGSLPGALEPERDSESTVQWAEALSGSQDIRTSGSGTWRRTSLLNPDWPSARREHGMVFDTTRGRLVTYGAVQQLNPETWEWNGTQWSLRTVIDPEGDGEPQPIWFSTMSYDPIRGETVMFGGTGPSGLWLWNGSSWRSPTPTDPEGDGNPAPTTILNSVYDSNRGVVLLFGEAVSSTATNRVWAWNGESWSLDPLGDPETDGEPDDDNGVAAYAFDPIRGEVVAFGAGRSDETWIYTGSSWRLETPSTRPPPRENAAMVFHPDRGTVVMFGGFFADMSMGYTWINYDDLWEWDGVDWQEITPTDENLDGSPPGRDAHRLVYDPVRRGIWLFGGIEFTGSTQFEDLWLLEGTNWVEQSRPQLVDTDLPAPRGNPGLASFPALGGLVLFGGDANGDCEHGATATTCNDTWLYNGQWSKLAPASRPGDRYSMAMIYDEMRSEILLFGGRRIPFVCDGGVSSTCDTTWTFNGSTWANENPVAGPDGNPSGRYDFASAYDAERGVTVVFDGRQSDSMLWEWDGSSWSLPAPAGMVPDPRVEAGMVFDDVADVVVLFGGIAGVGVDCDGGTERNCGATWTWDGGSWTMVAPSDASGTLSPAPRADVQGALVWDPEREKVLLFGGDSSACTAVFGQCDETWQWDGVAWSQLSPADIEGDGRPGPKEEPAIAADPIRQQVVMVGGGRNFDSEVWEWDGARSAYPFHVFRASFLSAQGPEPWHCLSNSAPCLVDSVAVTWEAAGVGQATPGVDVSGAVLSGWVGGGFTDLGPSNSASVGTPTQLRWSTSDAANIAQMFTGSDRELVFAIHPVGANLTRSAYGEVQTSYVEARVLYRHP